MSREYDYTEIFEDCLINVCREFSKKGFADFSTGFQRYYVKDIIGLADLYFQYLEYGDSDKKIMERFKEVCKNRGFYSE